MQEIDDIFIEDGFGQNGDDRFMEENTNYPDQNNNQGENQNGNQMSDSTSNDYVQEVQFAEQPEAAEVSENSGSTEDASWSNGYPEYNNQSNSNQDNSSRNASCQGNVYQPGGYQAGTYSNVEHQNGAYQNNIFQNGNYQNNSYPNNAYFDNTYQNYNGGYQPYNGAQPYYGQMELEEPVKVSEWVLAMVLMMIPCVNIIMMFVWAFSSTEKKSKSNFFKAYLIFFGISMGVMLLVWIAVVVFALMLG